MIVRAEGSVIGNALRAATGDAQSLGIFGSPTFGVGGEIFWGDDRLDDALAWHLSRTESEEASSRS